MNSQSLNIERWLDDIETEEDDVIGSFSDEEDDDYVEESLHDTDSEQEMCTDNNAGDVRTDELFYGKDKSTLWQNKPFRQNVRTSSLNLFRSLPKLNDYSKNVQTPLESWKLLFTFIDTIVDCTNIYIRKLEPSYKRTRDVQTTDSIEINAVLGLLYLAGIHKSSHVNVKDLWETDGTGLEIFHATMSYNRFLFLMRCIRFDNIADREDRRKTDKLAAIRNIYETFNENIEKSYNVGMYVTVDEKLESFRGRCCFRQYIPNKPAKYGIKIFSVVDSVTYYTSKLEIYCGKQPAGQYETDFAPAEVVKRLTSHLQNAGRNVTMDNWFTSVPLSAYMLEKRTTIVGTIRKNKKEIPPNFIVPKARAIKSTLFAFQKTTTLISYVPKKNKCVLLLSTMHHGNEILEGEKQLPEIISFYNGTKGAVDTTDQLGASYNVARNCRRWPLVTFYSFMNVAGINARVILLSTQNPPNEYKVRKQFLKHLSLALIQPQIDRRSKIRTLPTSLQHSCNKFATKDETYGEPPLKMIKQGNPARCQLCATKKDRKTKTTCENCNKYICRGHCCTLCVNCFSKIEFPKDISTDEDGM